MSSSPITQQSILIPSEFLHEVESYAIEIMSLEKITPIELAGWGVEIMAEKK